MDNDSNRRFLASFLASATGLFGTVGAAWVLGALVTVVVNLAFLGLIIAVIVMTLRWLGVAI